MQPLVYNNLMKYLLLGCSSFWNTCLFFVLVCFWGRLLFLIYYYCVYFFPDSYTVICMCDTFLYHVTLKRRAANPHAVLKYMMVIHLHRRCFGADPCVLWPAHVCEVDVPIPCLTSNSSWMLREHIWTSVVLCCAPQTRLKDAIGEATGMFWIVARQRHKKIQLLALGNRSFTPLNMVT